MKRWIAVPGIGTFQPSEIAKVAVIMYFSARLSKRNTEKPRRLSPQPAQRCGGLPDRIGFLELVPYGLILLLIVGLMMLEPHMSGTILILAGAAAVLFAAGISSTGLPAAARHDGAGGARDERLPVHPHPGVAGSWAYPRTAAIRLSSPLRHRLPAACWAWAWANRQKFLLPEPENDFIFAIVCEELGLIGAGIVLILFCPCWSCGATGCHPRQGPLRRPLLVVGITTLTAVQVF